MTVLKLQMMPDTQIALKSGIGGFAFALTNSTVPVLQKPVFSGGVSIVANWQQVCTCLPAWMFDERSSH